MQQVLFYMNYLISCSRQPYEVGTSAIPIVRVKTVKHKKLSKRHPYHTLRAGQDKVLLHCHTEGGNQGPERARVTGHRQLVEGRHPRAPATAPGCGFIPQSVPNPGTLSWLCPSHLQGQWPQLF